MIVSMKVESPLADIRCKGLQIYHSLEKEMIQMGVIASTPRKYGLLAISALQLTRESKPSFLVASLLGPH